MVGADHHPRFNNFSPHMKALHGIAFVLVIIGGLNWGLVAVGSYMSMNLNVVNLLLGSWSALENLVYLLVGISAAIVFFSKKGCCTSSAPSPMMQ
jgi:uncharacterized membrane protein YuzA (DUF378 family)